MHPRALMTWLIVPAVVLTRVSIAQGAMPSLALADEIVQPAMRIGGIKGCVVGLIDEHGRRVTGYGATRGGVDEKGVKPDGRTVFEIGSVTKVFTAVLLQQMADAGEVRLDQPVNELLPPHVRVPSEGGTAITLLHLTTQTSGLPRMPSNFDPADWTDPYADFDAKRLYAALAKLEQLRRPGKRYAYSNLGVGLLGHALSLKAGKSYEALLLERICTPLGMNDTRLTMTDAMMANRTSGHIPGGAAEVADWHFDALAGAGAIRSTADDMLTFLAANMGLVATPLAATLKATHAPRAATGDGDGARIAMGWFVGKRTGARWHDGQTGGYHSFVAFVPEKRVGVVVFSNTSGGITNTVGTQLIQLMLGEDVKPLTLPAEASAEARRR